MAMRRRGRRPGPPSQRAGRGSKACHRKNTALPAVMPHVFPNGSFPFGPRRKRDPGLAQLGRKCCAELVFQTPDQRITKRVKVRSLNSEICMLPTRVPDDRLKQFMLIKCPNDCRDHVHELEVLSFHVAREQTLRIGSKLEEPAIEQLRDFASDGPDRIE